MKAEAIQLVAGESDPATVMNLLREYLQAITLRSLHESEAFSHLAFVGGTHCASLTDYRAFPMTWIFHWRIPRDTIPSNGCANSRMMWNCLVSAFRELERPYNRT